MVEDRLTDGTRIAQLLSSELSARENGPLARVSVVDADRRATASEDGTDAYSIAIDDEPVAIVTLYPEKITLRFETSVGTVLDAAAEKDFETDRADGAAVVHVESGAAVKRAVDVVAAVVEAN